MKSFSLFLKYAGMARVIPAEKTVIVDAARVDVIPCSIAIGEMTPAPPGTMRLSWDDGVLCDLPENALRSIVLNE